MNQTIPGVGAARIYYGFFADQSARLELTHQGKQIMCFPEVESAVSWLPGMEKVPPLPPGEGVLVGVIVRLKPHPE